VKPDTIVQIWSGDAIDVDRVTSSGLRALFSTCWYLDYTSYGQDWDKYYRCEQISELDLSSLLPPRCQSLLLSPNWSILFFFTDDFLGLDQIFDENGGALWL
jgi:hypothetical protein